MWRADGGRGRCESHRGRRNRADVSLTRFRAYSLVSSPATRFPSRVNRVSAGTLYEISQVLDLPISWFFDEDVVNRIGEADASDTTEFSDCMNLLLDLRQSSNLGPVREVLRLAGAR